MSTKLLFHSPAQHLIHNLLLHFLAFSLFDSSILLLLLLFPAGDDCRFIPPSLPGESIFGCPILPSLSPPIPWPRATLAHSFGTLLALALCVDIGTCHLFPSLLCCCCLSFTNLSHSAQFARTIEESMRENIGVAQWAQEVTNWELNLVPNLLWIPICMFSADPNKIRKKLNL
jgi:hypothetical protein